MVSINHKTNNYINLNYKFDKYTNFNYLLEFCFKPVNAILTNVYMKISLNANN